MIADLDRPKRGHVDRAPRARCGRRGADRRFDGASTWNDGPALLGSILPAAALFLSMSFPLTAWTVVSGNRTLAFPSGSAGRGLSILATDGAQSTRPGASSSAALARTRPRSQVEAAMKSGELVEVLAGYALPPRPIQAVHLTSRLLSAKVRVFLEMAVQAAPFWASLGSDQAG